MIRERDKLRHELETSREESIRQLIHEKDESTQRYEKEKEDLHYELASAITERDQTLVEAENEKQKVMSCFAIISKQQNAFRFIVTSFSIHKNFKIVFARDKSAKDMHFISNFNALFYSSSRFGS